MRLQIDTSCDGADSIQDGVAGPRLGDDWIVSNSRAIPVITIGSVSINFKALFTFGI